eukprot:8377424-Pyramimonas_sp.AAC.1
MEERGFVFPSVRVFADSLEAANRASASTQVGDIGFRVVAELYSRPSRSDEVVSDSICNNHIALRHPLLIPNRPSLVWRDLISTSGCMGCHYYNN